MLNLRRIRIAWIWVVFVIVTLFLLSSNLGRRRPWNPFEKGVVEVTAPFQNLIQKTIGRTEDLWSKYFGLIHVRDENLRLKRELNALRMESYRYQELRAANKRLQELLQFKETIHGPVLAAQVIGRDPSGWFKSVIIDKGERSGLKIDMPVVNARGVVGRLVSVSAHYAKVLLIIDQNSAVDCVVQRSRDKGILKGISSKACKLDYVIKTSEVAVDDLVVTSGLGGVFPKSLPVGKVIAVESDPGELFKAITVEPLVDFSKLEELLVILKENTLLTQQKEEE